MDYKHKVSFIFVISLFMELLDSSIVHVALPTVRSYFGTTTAALHWVATAYILAIAVCIPFSAWASDRFGTRQVLQYSLVIFSLGSLGCAAATSFPQLVAARVLQGVGGGMMSPVGSTMLMRAYPLEERAKAAGVLMFPSLVAPAMGPWMGGYLVQYFGWRWIFLINLPACLLALGLASVWLRAESVRLTRRPFDAVGMVATGCSLGLIFYALSQAAQPGGPHHEVLALGLVALVLFGCSILWLLHNPAPLLDLRLFRDPNYLAGSLLQFLLIAGLCGSLFTVALCQQDSLGRTPLVAGAISSAQAAGIMAAVTWAGRTGDRIGRWTFICWGLFAYAATTCLLTHEMILENAPALALTLIARGIGLGCCLSLTWVEAFSNISAQKTSQASALLNVVMQLGNAAGVALAAAFVSYKQLAGPGTMNSFRQTFWGFAFVAVCSWVYSLFTSRRINA